MSSRPARPESLGRARTAEEKAEVRQAFIAAGRRLFASADPSTVSLRRIAAAAGYAPGTIYPYFEHQQDLFFQVRAQDMQAATERLRRLIARERSPLGRVRKLFIGTADHWLEHMEAFPAPSVSRPQATGRAGEPFAESAAARDSRGLYHDKVDDYFKTLARPPLMSRLAADTLIAAVHGTIVFPCMTRSMDGSDTRTMVKRLVTSVLADWSAGGPRA